MQHNLVRRALLMALVPLAPVIADRICKDVASVIEVCRRNSATDLWITFETMLRVFVPEVKCAVRAGSAECAVDWMEADGIDRVDVANGAVIWWAAAVAFEAEVSARVLLVNVLNRTTTFDAADSKTGGVVERADDTGLPFEWGLDALEKSSRVSEINNMDLPVRCANNEHLVVADVHAIDSLLDVQSCHGLLLSKIPVFDRFVPAASYQHWAVVRHERLDAADGLIVGRNLLCCGIP